MPERLQILGPCGWWAEGVRSARWSASAGDHVPVAVVVGPEVDEESFHRWRERSAPWLGRPQPGVHQLLAVERTDRRTAWVYPDWDGVSLLAAMRAGTGPLPMRVAAELVARCAEILEPLAAEGGIHPGPDPADVLIRADGEVLLTGFTGPYAPSPSHREPRGAENPTAVVWRLGVLLAELLTGSAPSPATERAAHELGLRRLLIRVMSRPGPMFPERYRDWLTGMSSWDADQRPLLSRIAPGLRELAATLPQPGLEEWAARRIPELRGRAPAPALATVELPDAGSTEVAAALAERTEELGLADTFELDDETAVSADGDPPRRGIPTPERGTIPVHVGPPPEAVPKLTRLPEELFRTPQPLERTEVTAPGPLRWSVPAVLCAILFVLALLLSWYLWE